MPTKILVVDDSATMRRVLQMTFAAEDAYVVAVDSGEAGVTKATELSPDVVFADASMPGCDGYELARRIKSNPALARTAVILMASQHHPYEDAKGRSAGIDDHISKPFDTQSVIDRVTQVLARPRNTIAGGEAPRPAAPPAAAPAARPQAQPTAPVQAAATSQARTPAQATRVGFGHTLAMGQPAPAPVARPTGPAAFAPQAAAAPPAMSTPAFSAPAPAPAAPAPTRPTATVPLGPAPAPTTPNAAVPRQMAPAPQGGSPPARPAAPVALPVAPAVTDAVTAVTTGLASKLSGLGLSREQMEGVLSLSREVIEQVVWEVVPDLAEQLIREEIKRLTADT